MIGGIYGSVWSTWWDVGEVWWRLGGIVERVGEVGGEADGGGCVGRRVG